MQVSTTLSDQIARYLDLANTQVKLTAENMANVDTPGYHSVGMNFEAEMRNALSGVEDGQPAQRVQLQAEGGLVSRPDGNNVSMDREGLNLAEAQLKFRTGISLLRQQYQTILDAIHADAKS